MKNQWLIGLLVLFLSPFGRLLSQPANNNFASAADVSALINSACTTSGAFTTQLATPDQSKPACWSNGPNNNVWFKFTATATTFINVKIKVSGPGETIQNPFVAIFNAGGVSLACQNFQGAKTNLSLSYLGLVAGNTYYIDVDNYSGYSGSFDLCLSDVIDYDFKQGAMDVTSQINSTCTTGGSYTTQFATPDQSKGTCWSNGPNNNVWFKFTATATTFINAKVKVSGAGETMQNPFVAIFDAGGTQLTCQNYQGAKTDLSLSYLGLVAGNTYYIAVDNYSGYAGSFDLCLSDAVDYDFKQGAKDLTAQINSTCTAGGTYTTQFATPDQSKGTCWSNGPNNNVWFKFTASSTAFINAKVKVSGAGETMQNPFVAIFDAGGTQLTCQNYQGAKTNLSLSYLGLVPGNTYYIAVDSYSGYAGSFDLCLSDVVDYDFKQGAMDLTAQINSTCTTGGSYTTQFATPDQSKGTCWSNGPNNNVWFKFTATATSFINAKVKVSGAGETMQNPFVAIFDAGGTQLTCQNYQGAKTDLSLSYLGLVPGNTYYIAVDSYSGYAGSFDLCLSDVVDYDFKLGAKDVTAQINSTCTTGGSYTTQFATPDQSKGTCWSNGPNNNVWFKFTATATAFINAKVKVSGAGETMQNPFVAIFDAGGTQLACQNFLGAKIDQSLSYFGLVPGNTYYIAVDSYSGYAGSFDLCLSDVVDYDFKQGAKDLTSQINSTCTTGGVYSTQYGTPDQIKGTCWSNGPNNNVWFKFTATATTFINAKVKVSGAGETIENPFVAIFDASGTQLACQNYQGAKTDLSLSYLGLVPGNTYYIAVDNYSGYWGSFDLCLSDVMDYDFKQGAKDVTAQMNSTTSGGTYSTQYASPDQSKGSCWSNGPNNNVWFSFTATSTGYINATAVVSGAGETMQYSFVALYNASGTQLACQNYQAAKTDISVTYSALIPGNTYYIAVDSYAGYKGSFDLGVYDNLIVLPLDGLVLKASVNKSQVDLKWTTNSESNTGSFIIERAKDGIAFDSIGRVFSIGTLGSGYTSTGSSYVFTDKNPYTGNSFYRLRATDPDGHFSYSTTVPVSKALSIKAVFTLFPNPNNARSVTWLKMDGVINNSSISVAIYSMQGQRVFSKVVAIDGSHSYLLPIDTGTQLAAGIYDVIVIGADTGTLIYQQKLLIR